MRKFAVFIIGMVIFTACSQQVSNNVSTPSSSKKPSVNQSFQAVPGQKFGEMFYHGLVDEKLYFTGTTEISGNFYTSELDGNTCLLLDEKSRIKIPHWKEDDAYEVCFSNQDAAKKLIGNGNGEAKVVIEGYSDTVLDSSVLPSSKLVKVVSKVEK